MGDRFDREAELDRLGRIAANYDEAQPVTERELDGYVASRGAEEVVGPEVLVLGAATGVWAQPLLQRWGRFDVVDAVEPPVRRLEHEHRGKVRGFVSLFEEYTPDRTYDTVVMGHVLEHVADPVGILGRARSWLAPGGRIVILVPNAHSLHREVGVRLGVLPEAAAFSAADHQLGHRRVYSRETLRADVSAAGLVCVRIAGLALKPLSNRQMDGWSPELRRAFFELGDRSPELACVILCVAAAPSSREGSDSPA